MFINRTILILIPVVLLLCGNVCAQDFGFGFDDEDETVSSRPVTLKAGGEIILQTTPFFNDIGKKTQASLENIQEMTFANLKLNFSVSGSNVEFLSVFNLNPSSISELWSLSPVLKNANYTPLFIDEVFLRSYMGSFNIEAGFRKLSWGRADSGGPLDVTNPIDFSDLRNITDTRARKIARPMIHATWNANNFSKLEGVIIPNFYAHRFAVDGRWAPSQYTNMMTTAEAGITLRANEKTAEILSNPALAAILNPVFDNARANLLAHFNNYQLEYPKTSGLKYFQAGLRYTTTIGSADIGAQYFFGNLFRPNFTIAGVDDYLDDLITGISTPLPPFPVNPTYEGNPTLLSPQIKYTRYHQFGIDYAQVLFGFNIRAEFAFFLTEDYSGDDGSLKNPFIGWSLGFDRNVIWGINMNLQCNETIRLFNSKVGNNSALDTEADTNITSTRLTLQLSRKFFRDNLESKAVIIWDIEDSGVYIIPAVFLTSGDLIYELSAGIFAGNKESELGQYRGNSFLKLGLSYTF
ncbi:MAG: hypothetical protein LBI12_01980 [Treponema sp.]|jgi:hypothetical protein|nr:hypothetical protein [Treponema sp.]